MGSSVSPSTLLHQINTCYVLCYVGQYIDSKDGFFWKNHIIWSPKYWVKMLPCEQLIFAKIIIEGSRVAYGFAQHCSRSFCNMDSL